MRSFTVLLAVSALGLSVATASFAGNIIPANNSVVTPQNQGCDDTNASKEDDCPVAFMGSAGLTPEAVAGLAIAAFAAAALGGSSSTATTTTTP
jgi:hypothetical protein